MPIDNRPETKLQQAFDKEKLTNCAIGFITGYVTALKDIDYEVSMLEDPTAGRTYLKGANKGYFDVHRVIMNKNKQFLSCTEHTHFKHMVQEKIEILKNEPEVNNNEHIRERTSQTDGQGEGD